MLPLLLGRLAAGACAVLDDADRPGERAVVAGWRALWPDPAVSRPSGEKGICVLRLGF